MSDDAKVPMPAEEIERIRAHLNGPATFGPPTLTTEGTLRLLAAYDTLAERYQRTDTLLSLADALIHRLEDQQAMSDEGGDKIIAAWRKAVALIAPPLARKQVGDGR